MKCFNDMCALHDERLITNCGHPGGAHLACKKFAKANAGSPVSSTETAGWKTSAKEEIMDYDKERELFEKWYVKQFGKANLVLLKKEKDLSYVDSYINAMFLAFCAGRQFA